MTTKKTHRSESVARLVVRTAAVIACLLVALSASAGNLAVTTAAAYEGTYGLEVTVGSSCTSDADLVLDDFGTVSTDQEGCDTITAGGSTTGTTVSGTVTFTAGTSMTFTNGFSVASGSDFTAAIDATLTPFAWVQDDSPSNETTYSAEFWVNADALTMGGSFKHFVAYSGSPAQLWVIINNSKQAVLEVRDDAGVYHASTPISLGSGYQQIGVSWEAASSATASITVGTTTQNVSGIDTDARRIAFVRWGAVGGSIGSTAGTIEQDMFTSWR